MTPERAAFEAALSAIGDGTPDSVQYQALSGIALTHELAPQLLTLDPFSADYRSAVLRIYRDLRGGDRAYLPEQDEKSGMALPQDLVRGVSPWFFRDTALVSEFLLSWGQIMRALALPPGSDAKILEYGTGSGQLLLFLARLGLQTSAVDIDAASLELVRAQAEAMQLDVRTEQGVFGEGFEGESFDRIIFFEAFHHAIDFTALLRRLRQRLRPGGLLVLCGEPVVGACMPAVPYPWGPRLDGLSVFCIRRYGWMELGFTEPFLIEALHRHGWLVDVRAIPDCGRATTYVARPYVGVMIEVGKHVSLGPHDGGWQDFEGSHRWTRGDTMATFPLPDQDGPSQATIRLSNVFPIDVAMELYDGETFVRSTVVPAGSVDVEIVLGPCMNPFFAIKAAGSRPDEVWPGSGDRRSLGVAVSGIRIDPV